ncbi:FAD binding domain-containing protein [Brevibacillus centrosporus]|jgi:carbon-monoxide dehydrogenase medium subunit|uniref:Carbon-monoxide dehydrogenase medium subunit n=1 Tax=Brevibacillus centrosporus TaxID=54910 RepID=A0A1I4DL33_9BACL|nr:xanthine dehydrogenase family protein subunit M [Brevibacillus centrosporus]MEC2129037.1 xanthine dehydrogenase family protein subunit M [Brevibacillus centrosporus]MED4911265.1 xanthine dehydrogenase family protein subunit M [Brevibacillus centrosporus]RNB70601.1 xanthine dehydrogenase family protein subunit M [Brevibacillus centrosporus]SFK92611.1 carbon-monoxide dehydrogenase medium subunit [Brevibacillus centrosporus]GED29265.1 dehydrogenase [Brevibacillus centrosporus]
MIEFSYSEPDSLVELLEMLEEGGNTAALLAGGTDLVNHIRIGKRTPNKVISLKSVRELNHELTFCQDGITIGALTTLSAIEKHSVVREMFPALAEAVNKIGSTQIRNKGTLVGNLCNASPAADAIPALLIYNAVIHIVSKKDRRTVPVEAFMKGPGKTDLQQGEIVESIFVPTPPANSGSCYLKSSRRDGADLTIVGAAALVALSGEVRIGLGAVAPVPFRAHAAEKMARDEPVNLDAALDEAVKQANPISDLRASREYRLAMIKTFTRKAIHICRERIQK